MKTIKLKKIILAAGVALAGLALTPSSHAQVTVNIEGGSASSTVLFDRATNVFAGGAFSVNGSIKGNVAQFVGSSLNPNLNGYGTITLNINLNNGAINGLSALVNQAAGAGDTNYAGAPIIPTFVDSATSPEAVGIDSVAANLTDLPTYVVPLVYVRNTNYPDVYAITNLTQRQAVELETTTNKAYFYGSTGTNYVYFVGRNRSSAVRTEIDLNIYNTGNIKTFTNNAAGLPVQDGSADPGLSSASKLVTAVTAVTNSIGTVAVQNATPPLAPIAFEGVPYSVTNVINGSYPLWGTEHYYYITSPNTGAPSTPQQAVINVLYNSVTNAAFQSITNPVFTNNFVPIPSMKVQLRTAGADGGPIIPLPNY
ncbi:MAG: hypothetical protein ABSH15_06230 [Verrucomicrobiota bacterium]|jgi:hypothetical protein